MLIVCPNCATSYQVDPASLGASGRAVRCARCKKTWFASNPEAMSAIARSHQEEVAAFAATTSVNDFSEAPPGTVAAVPVVEAAPPTVPADGPGEPPPAPADHVTDDDGVTAPSPEPEPAAQPAAVIDHEPAPDDRPVEAGPVPPLPEDIESVAARRMRRNAARRRSRLPGWSTAILALIAINTGLIAFRTDIVRFMPQTASLYASVGLPVNLRGLEFSDIVTRKEVQDGVQMLVVEGFIRNASRRSADVPRLRFAVRNIAGQEIYSWTALPARNTIPPGMTLPFRSRLASPPPEAHAVLVRFFNRRDLVAGL